MAGTRRRGVEFDDEILRRCNGERRGSQRFSCVVTMFVSFMASVDGLVELEVDRRHVIGRNARAVRWLRLRSLVVPPPSRRPSAFVRTRPLDPLAVHPATVRRTTGRHLYLIVDAQRRSPKMAPQLGHHRVSATVPVRRTMLTRDATRTSIRKPRTGPQGDTRPRQRSGVEFPRQLLQHCLVQFHLGQELLRRRFSPFSSSTASPRSASCRRIARATPARLRPSSGRSTSVDPCPRRTADRPAQLPTICSGV